MIEGSISRKDLLCGRKEGGAVGRRRSEGNIRRLGHMAQFMHGPPWSAINPFYLLWICYLAIFASVITLCHLQCNGESRKNGVKYSSSDNLYKIALCNIVFFWPSLFISFLFSKLSPV